MNGVAAINPARGRGKPARGRRLVQRLGDPCPGLDVKGGKPGAKGRAQHARIALHLPEIDNGKPPPGPSAATPAAIVSRQGGIMESA